MAYGHGDRDSVKRLLPLGVGELSEAKRAALAELRHRYLAIAEAMAAPAFDPEPLSGQTDIEAVLTAFQREHVKGFNKAYAEKTRLAVTAHLTEQRRRYFNQLVGRLRHAASRIEDAETPRRYYYVPEAMQDVITGAELEALQSRGEDYAQALELFRAVVLRGELAGLTANQLAVVREIHAQAQQRYRLPRYGADPEFVCQIHLDYRVIRGDAVTPLREGARLLVDKANARYHVFLEISHPVPHQAPIRLPLSLQSWTLRRLLGDGEDAARETTLKSLVLEIGRRRVGVKAVLSRMRPETDPATITHVLSRDFGYAHTVALSLIRLDAALDAERLTALAGMDKAAAAEYLRSHCHPGDNRVGQWLFSGRRFLAAIARRARQIDALRSEIDHHYHKIHRLREIIGAHLGLDPGERIERDLAIAEPFVHRLAVKFFRLLDRVQGLKQRRRALYRKIAGLKKAWFGYLSNIEVRLARTHNAAVVREHLTVMAAQKGSPGYKGRTFNRMINNGAKGQYLRRAGNKLQWNGVPEWTVPSYYTSSTCYKHARIDPSMRQGEVFRCPQCGKDEHADLHAAETIGNYFQLRPLPELA